MIRNYYLRQKQEIFWVEMQSFCSEFTSSKYVCVSEGKKCLFFEISGVHCFLVTPVLRFVLLHYYWRSVLRLFSKDVFTFIDQVIIQQSFNRNVIFVHSYPRYSVDPASPSWWWKFAWSCRCIGSWYGGHVWNDRSLRWRRKLEHSR